MTKATSDKEDTEWDEYLDKYEWLDNITYCICIGGAFLLAFTFLFFLSWGVTYLALNIWDIYWYKWEDFIQTNPLKG